MAAMVFLCLLSWAAAGGARAQDPGAGPGHRVLPTPAAVRQSTIEPGLAQYMQTTPAGDFIPIVVILKRQLSEEEKAAVFDSLPVTVNRALLKEGRRRALVAALQHLAHGEQQRLLDSLHTWEPLKLIERIRPLWVIDVVGVRATTHAIIRLGGFPEVASLHLDLPRAAVGAAPAWGVERVRADEVWAGSPTGYTGNDVIVGILDSGVDYTQRDLEKRIWINRKEDKDGNGVFRPGKDPDVDGVDGDPPPTGTAAKAYLDDVIGWDFAWDSVNSNAANEPVDDLEHGTLVAGIVAGDGTGGTATGVAPGSKLMVLRCTDKYHLTQEAKAWEGMEYALAKDAAVVNFSMGFPDNKNPAYAGWRQAVENLTDGGVLFVTITQNDANVYGDPHNVAVPGRVPIALTLGATGKADIPWPDSNYGPVTWKGVTTPAPPGMECETGYSDYPWPPGLLKPDVVAPGVDITSTDVGAGYVTDSGTSFAAPHAAGVAALLLEKDPGLTPYEIKFILEETAKKIADPQAVEACGWGRIDAWDATHYLIDRTPYDLAVTGTSALWTTADIWVDNDDDGFEDTPSLSAENHLYARIRNLGGEVPSNVEVKFFYADVATIGIGGFDPDGDGDPCDGVFKYIGSYRVPTMGPTGSGHETGVAVVHWKVPDPGTSHWCVGIGIVGGNSANHPEARRSNNVAFRNFFEIETSTSVFPFRMAPPPGAAGKPFSVEIVRRNLPASVRVEFVVDRSLAPQCLADPSGLRQIPHVYPGHGGKSKSKDDTKVPDRRAGYVRYEVEGDRAVLRSVVSPKGQFLPARLVIRSMAKLPPDEHRYVIVNTLDASGKPVGGFTLKIVDRK
jgi:subtilisin family serine protease